MIEDCASLMTNINSENIPGITGDYIIYSTGYSKTIDLGFDGLLFSSRRSLLGMEKELNSLPLINDIFDKETALFSKIYRLLRDQRHDSNLTNDFMLVLIKASKKTFYFV